MSTANIGRAGRTRHDRGRTNFWNFKNSRINWSDFKYNQNNSKYNLTLHQCKFDTGDNMECPKKHVKDDFVMYHFLKILKCPKIDEFHFRFLFSFKIDHVLKFWNPLLSYVRKFWNAQFFPFSKSNRKNGAFQNISTWSILKQKENRKEILRIWGISK